LIGDVKSKYCSAKRDNNGLNKAFLGKYILQKNISQAKKYKIVLLSAKKHSLTSKVKLERVLINANNAYMFQSQQTTPERWYLWAG